MSGRGIAALVAAALVILGGLLGGWGMMGWGMGPGMMGFGGYGGTGLTWWGVVMLVFWALLVGGIVWLVASLVSPGRPSPIGPHSDNTDNRRPLDILKERYARGELSREDYERMREELEK